MRRSRGRRRGLRGFFPTTPFRMRCWEWSPQAALDGRGVDLPPQSCQLLPQGLAVPQPFYVDSLRQRELAGQGVPLHRRELATQVSGPPHVRGPTVGQPDKRWQMRIVRSAIPGRDRAHRGIAAPVVAVVGTLRQWVAGLHRDRCMVARTAVDRAENRKLVGNRCLQRQMFAELHTRESGRDDSVRPANFARCRRLRIPHIELTGPTREPEQNHGFGITRRAIRGPALHAIGRRAHPGQARQTGRVDLQEPTP